MPKGFLGSPGKRRRHCEWGQAKLLQIDLGVRPPSPWPDVAGCLGWCAGCKTPLPAQLPANISKRNQYLDSVLRGVRDVFSILNIGSILGALEA